MKSYVQAPGFRILKYNNGEKKLVSCTYEFLEENPTEIILPECDLIDRFAFEKLSSLVRVDMQNVDPSKIDFRIFDKCPNLEEIVFSPESGYQCINGCIIESGELTHILPPVRKQNSFCIPNDVTAIGSFAFGCHNDLLNIEIPGSVTKIGDRAFYNCVGLTNINIPGSVTEIGYGAFDGCENLKEIVFEEGSIFKFENGFVFNTKTNELISTLPSVENIVIPDGTTKIGYNYTGAYSPGKPKSVYIPDSVKEIGPDAFLACKNLVRIRLPNGIDAIEEGTFAGCENLTDVTIPSGVGYIGDSAFSGCKKLTSINIPNSVTDIDAYAFRMCTGLTNVTIPNSVYYIGEGAFEGCEGLTNVTISNNVDHIRAQTFEGCVNLIKVEIQGDVTEIDARAFYGCENLTSIKIPKSVYYIASDAFEGCNNLKEISIAIGSEMTESYLRKYCSLPKDCKITYYDPNDAKNEADTSKQKSDKDTGFEL